MEGKSIIKNCTYDTFQNYQLLLGFNNRILNPSEVYCKDVAHGHVNWETLLQISQRLLATVWQICYRVSEGLATLRLLFNMISEVIDNPQSVLAILYKWCTFVRVLPITSSSYSVRYWLLCGAIGRGWRIISRHLLEGCPVITQGDSLLAIPLKNLN